MVHAMWKKSADISLSDICNSSPPRYKACGTTQTVPPYHQKSHLQRWQKADCAGRYSQSLYEAVAGPRMHPQGDL